MGNSDTSVFTDEFPLIPDQYKQQSEHVKMNGEIVVASLTMHVVDHRSVT